jgi:Raf kinase inhibitor-like YbhB/YbcL family protein
MDLKLTSSAFKEGETIPRKFTCQGKDISPSLAWDGLPAGTKTIALIVDDPDAPGGTWVHWVAFNIPSASGELREAVPARKSLDDGTRQGLNDFRKIGYGGPCPPPGPAHRYYFKLYALDASLDLESGCSKADLEAAMEGRILGEARLMGRYQR